MQSCLIRKKINPRKRRRRRGRLSQRPVEPEAKKQLAGRRSECTRQHLSCSTAAQCINDLFKKESLNTVQPIRHVSHSSISTVSGVEEQGQQDDKFGKQMENTYQLGESRNTTETDFTCNKSTMYR